MGRSGYVEFDGDDDNNRANLWRGTVERAIRGKRGRAFLIELAGVLDAMPVKELYEDVLVKDSAHVCALGAVAVARGIDVSKVNAYDRDDVAAAFGISPTLAAEIEAENDDEFGWRDNETPEQRWKRVRSWVDRQLMKPELVSPRVPPK